MRLVCNFLVSVGKRFPVNVEIYIRFRCTSETSNKSLLRGKVIFVVDCLRLCVSCSLFAVTCVVRHVGMHFTELGVVQSY